MSNLEFTIRDQMALGTLNKLVEKLEVFMERVPDPENPGQTQLRLPDPDFLVGYAHALIDAHIRKAIADSTPSLATPNGAAIERFGRK